MKEVIETKKTEQQSKEDKAVSVDLKDLGTRKEIEERQEQRVKEVRRKALEFLHKRCIIDKDLVTDIQHHTDPNDSLINPVLVNENGIIIDGAERLASNNNWRIYVVHNCSDTEALQKRYKYETHIKSPEKHKESVERTYGLLIDHFIENKEELFQWEKTREEIMREYAARDDRTREGTVSAPNIPEKEHLVRIAKLRISKELGLSPRTVRRHTPEKYKETEKRRKNKTMRKGGSSSLKFKCSACNQPYSIDLKKLRKVKTSEDFQKLLDEGLGK
jgi:hypothetical protein